MFQSIRIAILEQSIDRHIMEIKEANCYLIGNIPKDYNETKLTRLINKITVCLVLSLKSIDSCEVVLKLQYPSV